MGAESLSFLNDAETTFSSPANKNSESFNSPEKSDTHNQALVAVLEVITSNSNNTFGHVRAPEPTGGVQEWWARMLSGSINNSHSVSDYPAIGESL
jgi:hypothetical protein